MKKVIAPQPKNDSLIAQLAALYKTFKDIPPKENLEFDLSELCWFCPLLILPLSAYISATNSKYIKNQDQSYLGTIKFPHGIVDCGRGLAGAYKQEKNLIISDENAIKEVMEGNSTKPNNERGYGVRTSQKVVCEGLKGGFVLISGAAALFSSSEEEKLISLKDFYWQGVIIAYRIPKLAGSIDISQYLE